MGKQHDREFAPLEPQRAAELERLVNKAAQGEEVLLVDVDRGVVGSRPANLISPNENLNGLVRFGRHYGNRG
jgi:hypothetical protein